MAPKAASTEYSIEEDEGVTKVIDFAIQNGDGVEIQLERRRSLKRMGISPPPAPPRKVIVGLVAKKAGRVRRIDEIESRGRIYHLIVYVLLEHQTKRMGPDERRRLGFYPKCLSAPLSQRIFPPTRSRSTTQTTKTTSIHPEGRLRKSNAARELKFFDPITTGSGESNLLSNN
ncbi:hypothetical protein N431DRAFT_552253 [Stipitochalara longipes BDJ]|nr:hypothetical protein N431DRAFT_552253 [Stipitochalara longipes BDJ]